MAVQTSSETLLPFMRKNIEHIFKSKCSDWYGNGEHVSMITECEKGAIILILNMELLKLLMKMVMNVKKMNLEFNHLTGLNNFSMPLIRYNIGDIIIPSDRMFLRKRTPTCKIS